jgi:hypothetical protein
MCPDYPQLPESLQLVDVPLHGTDGYSKGGCKRLEAGEGVVVARVMPKGQFFQEGKRKPTSLTLLDHWVYHKYCTSLLRGSGVYAFSGRLGELAAPAPPFSLLIPQHAPPGNPLILATKVINRIIQHYYADG